MLTPNVEFGQPGSQRLSHLGVVQENERGPTAPTGAQKRVIREIVDGGAFLEAHGLF